MTGPARRGDDGGAVSGRRPVLGCLTGNRRQPPIGGRYSFRRRGLLQPLAPDLTPDDGGEDDSVAFAAGALTDGDDVTRVGWRGRTVGEVGLDICVALGQRLFVDRVVLRQAVSAPSAGRAAGRNLRRATDAAGAPPAPRGSDRP